MSKAKEEVKNLVTDLVSAALGEVVSAVVKEVVHGEVKVNVAIDLPTLAEQAKISKSCTEIKNLTGKGEPEITVDSTKESALTCIHALRDPVSGTPLFSSEHLEQFVNAKQGSLLHRLMEMVAEVRLEIQKNA